MKSAIYKILNTKTDETRKKQSEIMKLIRANKRNNFTLSEAPIVWNKI